MAILLMFVNQRLLFSMYISGQTSGFITTVDFII